MALALDNCCDAEDPAVRALLEAIKTQKYHRAYALEEFAQANAAHARNLAHYDTEIRRLESGVRELMLPRRKTINESALRGGEEGAMGPGPCPTGAPGPSYSGCGSGRIG